MAKPKKRKRYSASTDNGSTRSKTVRFPVELFDKLTALAAEKYDGNMSDVIIDSCISLLEQQESEDAPLPSKKARLRRALAH